MPVHILCHKYAFFYKVIYRGYCQSPSVYKIEAEQFGILVQLVAEMNTFQENDFPFFCLLAHSNGIGNHNSASPSGLFYTFFLIKKELTVLSRLQ